MKKQTPEHKKLNDIYTLNLTELRSVFRQFNNTLYGKTIFIFAYFIPLSLFISILIMLIIYLSVPSLTYLLYYLLITILIFIPTFILANIYFYNEVRKFLNHNSKKK